MAGGALPDYTNVTYVYIHGRSGYVGGNEAVADENYEFDVPVPERPVGIGAPIFRILSLPYGGPPPLCSVRPKPGDPNNFVVHVTYPLNLSDTSPNRRFAAIIASGWPASVSGRRFRTLTVHLDKLCINKDHNPICSADWRMWININGNWIKLDNLSGVHPGSEVPLNRDITVNVLDNTQGALFIEASGWVNVIDGAFGNFNDPLKPVITALTPKLLQAAAAITTQGKLGLYNKRYQISDNFGIGPHEDDSTSFEEIDGTSEGLTKETQGDFTLVYTISQR